MLDGEVELATKFRCRMIFSSIIAVVFMIGTLWISQTSPQNDMVNIRSRLKRPISLGRPNTMIIKSIALGLGIFFIGSIAYQLYKVETLTLPPPPGPNMAIGISLGTGYTIWSFWFWLGLVVSLSLGYCVARQFSARA